MYVHGVKNIKSSNLSHACLDFQTGLRIATSDIYHSKSFDSQLSMHIKTGNCKLKQLFNKFKILPNVQMRFMPSPLLFITKKSSKKVIFNSFLTNFSHLTHSKDLLCEKFKYLYSKIFIEIY